MDTPLYRIEQQIAGRCKSMVSARGDWPCHKGCDDCCRSLAALPRMSAPEWRRLEEALLQAPEEMLLGAGERIERSAEQARPVVCPLLDEATGACLVYAARPLACRSYGFYVERQQVLGCHRIEAIAAAEADIVWGNHLALEQQTGELGGARSLVEWWRESEALQEKRSTLVSPADRDNCWSRS